MQSCFHSGSGALFAKSSSAGTSSSVSDGWEVVNAASMAISASRMSSWDAAQLSAAVSGYFLTQQVIEDSPGRHDVEAAVAHPDANVPHEMNATRRGPRVIPSNVHEMERRGGSVAVVALCTSGGQAVAAVLERV
jgi:hypothetical protein